MVPIRSSDSPIDESFLTTNELLGYLPVNLRTVYRLIKAKKIPAVRVGRQWRFHKRDIDAWLEREQSHSSQVTTTQPGNPEGRSLVLVVDDETSICDLLSQTLTLMEYDVDAAPDGPEALERMPLFNYDLLITDLRMPGLGGLAFIAEARRLNANLPIITITGFSTEASAIEAVNFGVSGYLTNPFKVPKVLAFAAKALGESHLSIAIE